MNDVSSVTGGDEEQSGLSFDGLINEQETEKRDDRALAKDLSSFFNATDRVITMMRVYPFGHPLVDGLVEQLMTRLEPMFEREGEVYFNIDADELTTTSGTQVFCEEMAEKNQFIWYAPYADGLLQVEFEPDLNNRELASFLRVIDRAASGAIHSDDDTVTLLWEQQFESINYFAVEGFIDAGVLEDFGERTEKEAVELIIDAAIDPGGEEANELGALFDNLSIGHLDLFTRMQIEANAKIIVPELRDEDLAYAFAVDPALVEKLCDEWMAGADLEYRLIEALLSIIRVAPQSPGAARAAEMITSVTHQLLESEMFEQAVRILELLQDRRALFADAELDPLGELIEHLSDPMQVEALINIFQRQVKQRDAMMRLFLLLGRSTVLKQILNLLADDKRKVVALRQLMDIVFELVDEETEALVTKKELLESSTYLRRLMSELPDRDYIEWRPTRRLIRIAIEDSSAEVRELALTLKHPCWEDPNLAENYLVPMADDPDEGIRKLALELLGEKHPKIFRESIRDTILARKMGGRTHAELRFLMRVFLENSSDATEYLRSLLDTKGWFGGDGVEFAKMAAAILVEAGDEEAIAKIEAQQEKFFVSRSLKDAYDGILKRFGGATPVRSTPTAEETDASKPTAPSSAERDGAAAATDKKERPTVIEMPETDEKTDEEADDDLLTGHLPEGYE